ncbi:PREDICTED: uncharacterized protein LOC104741736 [Camelina sativa]|uniref:Uncharacterized protein LOC104741736 n=1 Tax=Camelina sativa TaxID=90675 RepID=A0ABM0VTN7_CAMSA|nr:PREDICTED: uncharacterized protein LOC104741736 [Camelina sativa]
MSNLSFMMAFLLSFLLLFSCQSIIIEARESKECVGKCPPKPSPSMIDAKEGVNKCPPTPSPSMIDSEEGVNKKGKDIGKCHKSPTPSMIASEETLNKVCMDNKGNKIKCHCKCPKHKAHTPSPSMMMDSERANNMNHKGHMGKCPPSPSPSMIDLEGVLIKECMDHKGRMNKCHCKCPKAKTLTPSMNDYGFLN